MKVLVTYYTMTGNTERIAKAIHQEVSKGHESYLKKVDEVKQEKLNLHDLIFVGSPTHAGNLAAPVKKSLANCPSHPDSRWQPSSRIPALKSATSSNASSPSRPSAKTRASSSWEAMIARVAWHLKFNPTLRRPARLPMPSGK